MPTTFLIVDDHPGFRSVAALVLEGAGFAVAGEACDGASALTATERLHPDAVLLDIELPDMTGFVVAERLAEQTPAPRVVLVSSRRASDFGATLTRAAAVGFIPKDDLSEQRLLELLGR